MRRVVAVAYSGGRDSTALLHATLATTAPLGCSVVALHVHHGLSPQADDWLAHCRSQVMRWQRRGHAIELVHERLDGRPARGDSVEAWARTARYAALQRMASAHGAEAVLLAHHRRDQAETFVLQALRGAGTAGLAGMPQAVHRHGVVWLRPWLHRPREEIEAYVRRHQLAFIDDGSNLDPRFARNRLRLEVWPALLQSFPHAEAALADAAGWAGQAAAGLQELALLDLAAVADDKGLTVDAWCALSMARRSNALRAWLQQRLDRPAPASLVLRLLDELPRARNACWPLSDGQLRSGRGRLVWLDTPAPAAAPDPAPDQSSLSIHRAGRYRLTGWDGQLQVTRAGEGGVPFARLGQLELRPRQGGEQFQAGPGRPPRSLKKQYQAASVPEWQRHGPLLYNEGQLVFVPGLGVDARVLALPGEPQASLAWLPIQATAG